ncbi:septum formation initiator family protein [Inediibacterium massiliense]|uniref:septum formation initiator family protein n=1 Tax=Inediibacterium massiliense TaxID=1658111 RepID=UPI0006B430AC|nr:septum formation initiator family protein [Inediibacterium massiliense]
MIIAQRKYKHMNEKYLQPEPKNERKKNTEKKIKASHKLQIIFGLLIVGSLCIGILLGYAKLTELKYKINGMNKDIHQMEAQIENLKVEVEEIKRSDWIEKKATEELGMQYPEKSQMEFIHVNSNSIQNALNTQEKAQKYEERDQTGLVAVIKKTASKIIGLLD